MVHKLNDVFIIGTAQLPVQKETSLSLGKLGAEAITKAMADANVSTVEAIYVGNMLSGICAHQQHLGSLIASAAGLEGVEAMTVEAACASGGGALHLGVLAIASGLYDCVAVCGLEIMSKVDRQEIAQGLATASNWEEEGSQGETFISLNAKLIKDYMSYYKVPKEVFGGFAVNAHHNALTNPNALFHKAITLEDYNQAKIIEDPLCLYDICPVCDGSAAIILVSKAFLEQTSKRSYIKIKASTVATDTLGLAKRPNLHVLEGIRRSSDLAYKQAGCSAQDLDLLELHDAYSIIAVLSLEGSGFAEPGKGFELAMNQDIARNGKIPISTFGGLKARGHPIGATGVYQCVEVALQLLQQAGPNQVPIKKGLGMAQSIGGCGGTVFSHILEVVQV